jgi:hypothetical protein
VQRDELAAAAVSLERAKDLCAALGAHAAPRFFGSGCSVKAT